MRDCGTCGANQTAKVESFTIITTEPNDLFEPIHNRTPMVLRPEDENNGLMLLERLSPKPGYVTVRSSRTNPPSSPQLRYVEIHTQELLKPLPAELIDAHDVSPIVNSAKYDGAECIQPVSDDEIASRRQLSLL